MVFAAAFCFLFICLQNNSESIHKFRRNFQEMSTKSTIKTHLDLGSHIGGRLDPGGCGGGGGILKILT